MDIFGIIKIHDHCPPVRAYVHSSGVNEAYGSIENCVAYLPKFLKASKEFIGKLDWVIAILWGNETEKGFNKTIDFFGFSIDEWSDNPAVYSWVVNEGGYEQGQFGLVTPITCGDGLILLGEEEKFRRKTTSSLEEYMKGHPELLGTDGKPITHFELNYSLD